MSFLQFLLLNLGKVDPSLGKASLQRGGITAVTTSRDLDEKKEEIQIRNVFECGILILSTGVLLLWGESMPPRHIVITTCGMASIYVPCESAVPCPNFNITIGEAIGGEGRNLLPDCNSVLRQHAWYVGL